MRHALAIAALALIPATGFAGDLKPVGNDGHTVAPDGTMWRMEGCAAYPVQAQAGAQSKPVAQSTPATTPKPAEKAKVAADEATSATN